MMNRPGTSNPWTRRDQTFRPIRDAVPIGTPFAFDPSDATTPIFAEA
jgi:hypothetical protein